MPVTLKDLAKATGISIGTISRALNNKAEVSKETSEYIRDLAKKMGYIPNRAGRALSAKNHIANIGILIPKTVFFDDIRKGILEAAEELSDMGLNLEWKDVNGFDEEEHLQALDELIARGCKSFIVCSFDNENIASKLNEIAKDYPVLLLNTNLPNVKSIAYVGPDYKKSGAIAAGMMTMCSHSNELKILVVIGSKNHLGHMNRVAGFKEELSRSCFKFDIVDYIEGRDNDIETQMKVMEAFKSHPEINCVYAATGNGIRGLGSAIIALGKNNKFIICCDDVYTTKDLVKTGIIDVVVCQEPWRQGYEAAKMMFSYLIGTFQDNISNFIVDNIVRIKTHYE